MYPALVKGVSDHLLKNKPPLYRIAGEPLTQYAYQSPGGALLRATDEHLQLVADQMGIGVELLKAGLKITKLRIVKPDEVY